MNEQEIRALTPDELNKLTDRQLRQCHQIQTTRVNAKAKERIEALFKGQIKTLAQALTTPPYVYTSPDITIMSGCTVRFQTLMKSQVEDAHVQLDRFIATEHPNDIRTTDFLNSLLLAHALPTFNGQDFGGVSLNTEEYQGLVTSGPDEARKMLETVRRERLKALGNLTLTVTQRLIEYYQVFQMTIESMSQSEDMEQALGN